MIKHYTAAQILDLDKVFRINMVNSLTGFKAANLIGTISEDDHTNLAIISSVVHLGANPALMGFIMRPTTVPRETYENIIGQGVFTINHVTEPMVDRAHQTSAKYPKGVSEFDKCSFDPEYLDDFAAPYVAESPIKIGLRYVEDYIIKANGTILVVGAVEHIYLPDACLSANGTLDLSNNETVALSGLDGYYRTEYIKSKGYART